MTSINTSQSGNLILESIFLINEEDKLIDIKNLVASVDINESMSTHFNIAFVTINDSYDLLNTFPIKGSEHISIIFSSGENNYQRKMTFFVNSIDDIQTIQDKSGSEPYKQYTLGLVSSDFLELNEKMTFQKHFSQKKKNDIIKELFENYGISLTDKTTKSEIINSYYCNSDDITISIDEILNLGSEPLLLYQDRDGQNLLNTATRLLIQQQKRILNGNTLTLNNSSGFSNGIVTDVALNDVQQVKIVQDDGINGYKLFDVDLFSDDYTSENIKNANTKKFDYSTETFKNTLFKKNCDYLDEFLLMKYLSFTMSNSDSGLQLGDLIEVENMFEGFIYSIQHSIDSNYRYRQLIKLVNLG